MSSTSPGVPHQSTWRFLTSLWRLLRGRPQIPLSLQDNTPLQLILRRRSVRSFTDQEIPDDVFGAILEAGRLAPSTVNLQTWSFAIFTAGSWKEKFGAGIPFKAQRAVIILGDTHRAKSVLDVFPYSPLIEYTIAVMNASLAAMNMNLAAEALGVASVMLSETGRSGVLDAGFIRENLALPPNVYPLMTIVFGYPRGLLPPMPPKLPLNQVIFTDSYQEADPAVMEDWLNQLIAGYKAAHFTSSFESQLNTYRSKIGQAEKDLQRLVFSAGRPLFDDQADLKSDSAHT